MNITNEEALLRQALDEQTECTDPAAQAYRTAIGARLAELARSRS